MYENSMEKIKQVQAGDKDVLEELINNNNGLIWNIVKRFGGRGYEFEDLYQIGCIGFIKAIKKFDTNFEVQLSTYAVPYILGEIKRFIRDDGIIKISRSTKELVAKIKSIQKEYLEKNGEEINISEISKILKISKEEIAAALDSVRPVESIYQEDSGNNGDNRQVIDKVICQKDEATMISNKLAIRQIIKDLNKREQEVIILRFYKEKTQAQVGKILGITQVQVSRIERKVLDRMRNKLEAV